MSSRSAVFASRNAHKARELERLLPGWALEPLDRADYPPENGETYYANARIKAGFGREHAAGWVLAEDSGLAVNALGGRPGVLSARYAPEGAPAVAKLLGELEERGGSSRALRSELVLLSPDGRELRGPAGSTDASPTNRGGSEGFGYDPIFVPDGEERHGRELGNEWKAQGSHRRGARRCTTARASSPSGAVERTGP